MLFLDTTIFLHAVGKHPQLRNACQIIIEQAAAAKLPATTNTEVVQEVLYVLARRKLQREALELSGHVLALFDDMLPVTRRDMTRARQLLEQLPHLPVRDAVHAATMQTAQIREVVTTDKDFDSIESLKRVDPLDLV
jgi:predicted nucleic acid-binding protein